MTMVRCQKSGPHLASQTLSLPAKKQKQIKEMIHVIRTRIDTVISHACADRQMSLEVIKVHLMM